MSSSTSKFDQIIYTRQKSRVGDIIVHLKLCNELFIPPLDSKINIDQYAHKLYTNAITFEAWIENKLVSLVAAYFNDKLLIHGFITNVSTLPGYGGRGIASRLLSSCINYGLIVNYKEILLEVDKRNIVARNVYIKHGFKDVVSQESSITMKLILKLK